MFGVSTPPWRVKSRTGTRTQVRGRGGLSSGPSVGLDVVRVPWGPEECIPFPTSGFGNPETHRCGPRRNHDDRHQDVEFGILVSCPGSLPTPNDGVTLKICARGVVETLPSRARVCVSVSIGGRETDFWVHT